METNRLRRHSSLTRNEKEDGLVMTTRDRRGLLVVCGALLVACGPSGSDEGPGSGGQSSTGGSVGSTGDSQSGSGGSAAIQRQYSDAPECAPQTCGGSVTGKWQVSQRCDVGGTLNPTSCSGASFSFSTTSSSGSVELTGSGNMTWVQTTTKQWSATYPSSCGSCSDLEGELGPDWAFLSCSAGAAGCECAGEQTENLDWSGTFATQATGIVLSPIAQFELLPQVELDVCATDTYLMIDSESTGRLVLSPSP